MCNQGDAAGSTWIWNFQPLRRRYVTRTSDDVPSGFIMHTAQGGTDLGACASYRYHLLAETSRRRMIHRTNYSCIYKLRQTKKLSTETRRCWTAATLITWQTGRYRLDYKCPGPCRRCQCWGNWKKTKQIKFCSLLVKYFATLFPDCTQIVPECCYPSCRIVSLSKKSD